MPHHKSNILRITCFKMYTEKYYNKLTVHNIENSPLQNNEIFSTL